MTSNNISLESKDIESLELATNNNIKDNKQAVLDDLEIIENNQKKMANIYNVSLESKDNIFLESLELATNNNIKDIKQAVLDDLEIIENLDVKNILQMQIENIRNNIVEIKDVIKAHIKLFDLYENHLNLHYPHITVNSVFYEKYPIPNYQKPEINFPISTLQNYKNHTDHLKRQIRILENNNDMFRRTIRSLRQENLTLENEIDIDIRKSFV
jgi:hypothetical protein